MKGLLCGALFCPLNRGKSGEAGKGEASAASQSAECFSCHMTQRANPVTLTSYSSPVRAIPQPSAQRAVKLTNLKNLRGEAPSTLTPERACPQKISFLFLPKSLKAPAVKRRGLSFPYGRWNREMPLSMMFHRTCVLCRFRIC